MIELSVALVTRNRSKSLAQTLYSLSLQNISPNEIIISDDSNIPEEIRANRLLAEKYNCKYVTGPQKGLYANRNFVAKQCSGTHIRTMDDDHEFPEGHIEACIQAIKSEPKTIWTIGEYSISNINRMKPYPIPGQLHPRGFAYAPRSMSDYYGISCGGSIYPNEIIKKNFLNVDLYKFGIVYLEYGARLKFFGYTLKTLPTTYLIHNNVATTANQLTKSIITEACLFSILCLSFHYQPSFKNKILTAIQVVKLILTKKSGISSLIGAYSNYKQHINNIENFLKV